MNTIKLVLVIAGLAQGITSPLAALAQQTSPAKPPAHHSTSTAAKTTPCAKTDTIQLPASIPPATGEIKSSYALCYIDMVVGTGTEAGPGMIYSVHYTGWLYDGKQFD